MDVVKTFKKESKQQHKIITAALIKKNELK